VRWKYRVALILLAGSSLGLGAAAQSVAVQFLNGSNYKPTKGKRIYVAFQNGPIRTVLNLHTDDEGVVAFDVEGAKTFRVAPFGYVPCGEQNVNAPLKEYSVEEVVNDGLLTRNTCPGSNGAAFKDDPQPGRMVYFVKKESEWESFKNLN
jgi:hypothetical protein